MADWCGGRWMRIYAAIFIDAIVVKVRDGQVAQPAVLCRDRGRPWPGNATSWAVGR